MKVFMFLLFCIPSYAISFFIGWLVMDATNNAYKATGTNAGLFALFMIFFFVFFRKRKNAKEPRQEPRFD